MSIIILRTDSENVDFQGLVHELDKDLKIRDGEEHAFFAQFNKIDLIRYVVVAYNDQQAVGCGAIKEYSEGIMEVKRMYVVPEYRGKGVATLVLKELEKWSLELNFTRLILETGIKQPEAIGLYTKNEYTKIPNYGQYENVKSSVCFEKYPTFHTDN
jgi:putative acetyltransferase